jgi:hypothetical protein
LGLDKTPNERDRGLGDCYGDLSKRCVETDNCVGIGWSSRQSSLQPKLFFRSADAFIVRHNGHRSLCASITGVPTLYREGEGSSRLG